jgi:RND family efflux transporter MFP subunit
MIKHFLAGSLAMMAVLLLTACDWDTRAATLEEPYLHQVAVQPVLLNPSYAIAREFAGEVQAGQSSQLGFEFPGQVAELLVDEGDAVAPGQVLARLDTRLLDSERDELVARRAELRAELATTQRNLERIEQLQAENLVSERERDDLAGRTDVLRASLQRVDAALEANSVRIDKASLRAPFAAGVAARFVDSGVVVDAGIPVFELVQAEAREVRAGVPVAIADGLRPGEMITVRVGLEETVGQLIGLGPVVDPATRSRALRVRVTEAWAPGELAYLQLEVPTEMTGTWLPDAAVTEGMRGTWVAYVAVPAGDGEAVLESRTVVIHHARGGELYAGGALEDGDLVVAAGLHRLAPGQRVRVTPSERFAGVR